MPKPGPHTFSWLSHGNPVRGPVGAGPNGRDNFCRGASRELAVVAIAAVAIKEDN